MVVNIFVLLGYKFYGILGVFICILGFVLLLFCIVLVLLYLYFKNLLFKILDGFFKGVVFVVIVFILYFFMSMFKKLLKFKINILLLIIVVLFVGVFNISFIYLIIGGGVYSLC